MLTPWKVGEPLRCTSLKGRGGVGQLFLGFHLCHFSCRDKLAELHGNMFVEECVKCGKYVSCEPGGGGGSGRGLRRCPQGTAEALHVLGGLCLAGPQRGVRGFVGRSVPSQS